MWNSTYENYLIKNFWTWNFLLVFWVVFEKTKLSYGGSWLTLDSSSGSAMPTHSMHPFQTIH